MKNYHGQEWRELEYNRALELAARARTGDKQAANAIHRSIIADAIAESKATRRTSSASEAGF